MFTLICILIYTLLVLLFVPLDKIADVQTKVKNWFKKIGQ